MKGRRIIVSLFVILTGTLFSGCFIPNLSTGGKVEKYPDIYAKRDELADFNAREDREKFKGVGNDDEKLKGKIAIIRKDKDSTKASLDRFTTDGEFSTSAPGQSEGFLPPEMYAKHPDEIETLIKLQCHNETHSGSYKQPGSYGSETIEVAKVVCDLALIDYKTATLLAKHTFGDNPMPTAIVKGTSANQGFPGEEIQNYLISLPNTVMPRTVATPTGETLSAPDLAAKFKKSPESVAQYNGKEITLNGYSFFSGYKYRPNDYLVMIGAKDASSKNLLTIDCYVDPANQADFNSLKTGEHNITVVGKFEAQYSSALLKNCRLVKAD